MNVDKIVAVCAIIVSFCALAVSLYQTKILSEEKDAAVWPYIQTKYSYGPSHIRLDVDNDGIGPAIIQKVYYQYKDTTFYQIQNLADFLLQKNNSKISQDINMAYSNIEMKGHVIKGGNGRTIFKIKNAPGIAELINHDIKDIRIVIDYCSIYKKCWRNLDNDVKQFDN